jgi:anti-anti-sigma factor
VPGAAARSAQGATDCVVRTVWVPPRALIQLIGELDLSALPALESTVRSVLSIQPPPRVVRFDLGGLRFMDVLGARALLDARARVSDLAHAEMAGGSRRVMDVLHFVERVADPATRPSAYEGPVFRGDP